MNSVFIMGADTGVGKSVVSAGFLKAGHGHGKISYWKPIQTGTMVGDDTEEVRSLTGLNGEDFFMEPNYRFTEPMAPVLAAEKWGKNLELDPILKRFEEHCKQGGAAIIEGAGGLLAPLSDKYFQADLMKALNVPVVIVGEDRTGIVNQVLMTIRCAKEWNLKIAGVVLMNSRGNLGNAPAIERFGEGVKVLLEVPPMPDKRSLVAHLAGDSEVRRLLGVAALPN